MMTKGSLMQRIREVSTAALQSGSLLPIPTDCEYLEDQGARFLVRVLSSLRMKDEKNKRRKDFQPGERVNPFLPPDADLFVGDLTDTHSAVLNKFNVMDRHLLIVTKEFEDQEMLLNENDFTALCLCMEEYEGLGFYNGGVEAGASQQHKHLQFVPLPINGGGHAVPVEPLLRDACFDGDIGTIPAFRFVHAFSRPGLAEGASREESSRTLFRCYRKLLERTGLGPRGHVQAERQRGPYCLLITRRWMLLVPRSREFFGGISINSLGFAGSFFVRDSEELRTIRDAGPLRVLKDVAVPRPVT